MPHTKHSTPHKVLQVLAPPIVGLGSLSDTLLKSRYAASIAAPGGGTPQQVPKLGN